MVQIEGKYKLEKSENFDEFMKELGVSFITRNLAKTQKPDLIISIDGDVYTIRTESSMKTTEIKFKLGEEFEEDRADGAKVKSVVTKDGDNKLVHVQKNGKEVKIIREFSDEGVTVTATVNGVTSVRFYKRQ